MLPHDHDYYDVCYLVLPHDLDYPSEDAQFNSSYDLDPRTEQSQTHSQAEPDDEGQAEEEIASIASMDQRINGCDALLEPGAIELTQTNPTSNPILSRNHHPPFTFQDKMRREMGSTRRNWLMILPMYWLMSLLIWMLCCNLRTRTTWMLLPSSHQKALQPIHIAGSTAPLIADVSFTSIMLTETWDSNLTFECYGSLRIRAYGSWLRSRIKSHSHVVVTRLHNHLSSDGMFERFVARESSGW